jgi:cytochrome c biogenesis protein
VFAVLILIGLGASLTIRRRRFWARLTPVEGGARTVVEFGGLARTDRAGYGEEFDRLVADLAPADFTQSGITAEHEES